MIRGNLFLFRLAAAVGFVSAVPLPAATVHVDALHERQVFRGFGTCLIVWNSAMVNRYRTEAFQRIYTEELNFNLLRVDVMPYVHPEVADPDAISYANFNIRSGGQQHADNARAGVFLDFAQAIHGINPEAKAILTVWSFPGWMKTNGSHLNGGDIRADRREHAAALLTEYVKQYEDAGIPVLAVSFANEPQFAQFYNSQVIEPESYAAMLAVLGERLEAEGKEHVMIYGPEHMTHDTITNTIYAREINNHPEAWKYLDAYASHGYQDGVVSDPTSTAAARLWDRIVNPNGWEFWITEGGTGLHDYASALDQMGFMLHHSLVDANASVFTPWQVTGDSASEHNIMVLDDFTAKSHVMKHFSSVIEPGMRRIHAETDDDVLVAAFADKASGELGLVLLNLTQQSHEVDLELPYLSLSEFEVTQTVSGSWGASRPSVAPVGGSVAIDLPARSVISLAADEVDFSGLPTLTLNEGVGEIRVPGAEGELTVNVSVTDPEYAWTSSVVPGQMLVFEEGQAGVGSGSIRFTVKKNRADVERSEVIDVNGFKVTVIQEVYVEPSVSWWNDVTPDAATGARNTALLAEDYPGIGWIRDEAWPYLYSYSLDTWAWVLEEPGDASSFYAYLYDDQAWAWVSGDWGWAYLYRDGGQWLPLN